jgi:hypothetical protein
MRTSEIVGSFRGAVSAIRWLRENNSFAASGPALTDTDKNQNYTEHVVKSTGTWFLFLWAHCVFGTGV